MNIQKNRDDIRRYPNEVNWVASAQAVSLFFLQFQETYDKNSFELHYS